MGLKIRSFKEIMTGMVDWTVRNSRKLTDFSPGSAIRTLYESVASEIELFYFNMYKNITWGIENAIFESFGFKKIDAREANGMLTLSFYEPLPTKLVIPAGTRFSTDAIYKQGALIFETRQPYYADKGSTEIDVRVFCTQKGVVGNVKSGDITLMLNPINFVKRVANIRPFSTGAEEESLAERKQRFNRFIETLARATKKAIEFGAKEVEGVMGVWVEESPGLVTVYAHDSNGDLPPALVEKLSEHLVNYRAAGVELEVKPIVKLEMVLTAEVTVLRSHNSIEFKQSLENLVLTYVNNFPVARSLYPAEIIRLILNYDDVGVLNCTLLNPSTEVIVQPEQILRLQDVKIILKER